MNAFGMRAFFIIHNEPPTIYSPKHTFTKALTIVCVFYIQSIYINMYVCDKQTIHTGIRTKRERAPMSLAHHNIEWGFTYYTQHTHSYVASMRMKSRLIRSRAVAFINV